MIKIRRQDAFVARIEHLLKKVYLPRILICLELLSNEQVWSRPNKVSNSVGNLVLHLAGNVRQWIISGLGGEVGDRERNREFSERGPLSRGILADRLHRTVREACGVLRGLSAEGLMRRQRIQKFRVTGMEAAFHVAEHFSYHAGQIILLTKILTRRDLNFTGLPGEKGKRNLPAL